MKNVATVYGESDDTKSYTAAEGLLARFSEPQGDHRTGRRGGARGGARRSGRKQVRQGMGDRLRAFRVR